MSEEGAEFRATKDIDLVIIVEAVDAYFGVYFWEYVKMAGYEHCNKSTGMPQFYRFSKPRSKEYPSMIELFTRRPDAIRLPEDAVLTPLPMEDDISSLSAILLDDDYYVFLKQGRRSIAGITVLDVPYLIPFKARPWLDLSDKKKSGEHVDSRSIRKHKNDVFRLTELLDSEHLNVIETPEMVSADMQEFIKRMLMEDVTDMFKSMTAGFSLLRKNDSGTAGQAYTYPREGDSRSFSDSIILRKTKKKINLKKHPPGRLAYF